ncbi:E3 ubiquitin-protein ligase RNF186-like [Gouania willdenowi]|nr:E3 ubiquitin-protein ligase RNF186-like [Gouania willdenowi]
MAEAVGTGDRPVSALSNVSDSRSGDEYECKICFNLFDLDRHSPKALSCSHTFCRECLDTLYRREGRGWRIGCPLCRHRTAVPDHRVDNLSDNAALTGTLHFKNPVYSSSSSDTRGAERQYVSSTVSLDTDDGFDTCTHVAFAISCVCVIFSVLAMVVLLFLGLIFVHNFHHIESSFGPVCLFAASVLALFSLILTWLICMLKSRPETDTNSFTMM